MKLLRGIILVLTIASQGRSQDFVDRQRVMHDLDSIRTAYHIPGIAFGVADCDSVLMLGAAGVRVIHTSDSITIQDRFHIGSLAKGFLSFIAGRLVDEGTITWNTRFFDLFPEMRETSRSEYHTITLQDLLSHRALVNPFNDWHAVDLINKYNAMNTNDRFSSRRFAAFMLTLDPVKYDSGQFYKYSNLGYLLASLMLEKASGLRYAQLIARTDSALGINFQVGWPMHDGTYQPSGHLVPREGGWGDDSTLQVWNGDRFSDSGEDYLCYCTPSGHLNVSMADYLKYLQFCLNGLHGRSDHLQASTYDFIFNGAREYAMGWGNDVVDGNHYYSHSGSIGTFFANAVIIKERTIAIAIMANAGNNATKGGLRDMVSHLEHTYAR